LELTLFGPDAEQMQKWQAPEQEAQALARETRWFQLKDADGNPIPIGALVTKTFIGEGELELGWVKIRRVRPNVFRFIPASGDAAEVDLSPTRVQAPPYPVSPDLTPTTLVKMGIEVLGGGTGFSTTQASCGQALCFNGQYLLIDAIPFRFFWEEILGLALP
jgi:hypothetical protein